MTNLITVDSTASHESIPPLDILEYCSPIIEMVLDKEEGFKEGIENNYAFFSRWQVGGFEVDEDGTYKFPEDKPLKPLVTIEGDGEVMYIYEYAIVVIVDKDGNKMYTRVD
jgi:hypothetical protein